MLEILLALSLVVAQLGGLVGKLPAAHASQPPVIAVYAQETAIYVPTPKERIQGIIREQFTKYGVNEQLGLFIAEHESRFNPLAKNNSSTATGLFQWLKGSWEALCEGDRFDPADSAECAAKTISESPTGIRHWTASEDMRRILTQTEWVYCPNYEKNVCYYKR